MTNKVTFRRIGGRVVPIRDTTIERAKGGALVAAGAAGGYAAGKLAAREMHSAALMANKRRFAKEAFLLRSSYKIRNLGIAGSAAVIGAGAHSLLKGTKLEKHPKTKAAVSTGAGIAGAFAVHSAFARGMGNRGFRVLKIAARRAILKT